VLKRRAVESIGRGNLEQVNRNPSAGIGGPVSVTINIFPPPGMDQRGLAELTVRTLERKMKDKGLRLGS